MNDRARKVGSFLRLAVKLPGGIEFAESSDGSILFSDPYNDDDIIYYVYICQSPLPGEKISDERLMHGIKISLLENPQMAFENINEAIKELKNVMAR